MGQTQTSVKVRSGLEYEIQALIACSLSPLERKHIEVMLEQDNYRPSHEVQNEIRRLLHQKELEEETLRGRKYLNLVGSWSEVQSTYKHFAYPRLSSFWSKEVEELYGKEQPLRYDLAYHYAYLDERMHHKGTVSWSTFQKYLNEHPLSEVYQSLFISER